MAAELWPLLNTAAEVRGEARVVNHSSISRKQVPRLEAKFLGKNGGNLGGNAAGFAPFSGPPWDRYSQTKLANLVFTYALHDRLAAAGSKVKVAVAHPGVAATNLQVTTVQGSGAMSGFLSSLVVSQSAEDGACGIVRCCCDAAVQSGEFYGPSGTGMYGPAVLLPYEAEAGLAPAESREMLWEQSEATTGVKFDVSK